MSVRLALTFEQVITCYERREKTATPYWIRRRIDAPDWRRSEHRGLRERAAQPDGHSRHAAQRQRAAHQATDRRTRPPCAGSRRRLRHELRGNAGRRRVHSQPSGDRNADGVPLDHANRADFARDGAMARGALRNRLVRAPAPNRRRVHNHNPHPHPRQKAALQAGRECRRRIPRPVAHRQGAARCPAPHAQRDNRQRLFQLLVRRRAAGRLRCPFPASRRSDGNQAHCDRRRAHLRISVSAAC